MVRRLQGTVAFLVESASSISFARGALKLSGADEDLDMRGSLQESAVQGPRPLCLSFRDFKIDVGLPQHLWHVQQRLRNAQLEDCTSSIQLPKRLLELSKRSPCPTVGREALELLLVDHADPVDVAKLKLHLYVALEDLFLRCSSDRSAQHLSCGRQVLLPDFELSGHDPELGECEGAMRYHFECLPVHQSRSLDVLERDFLEDSVVDPEVDVPSPCSLLHGWRFLSDRSLIYFPHLLRVSIGLLEPHVVEPSVVVIGMLLHLLLVLEASLGHDDVFDPFPVAMLLLECDKRLVQLIRFALRDVVQRKLVDRPRPL
mmetsp:Transcript_6612/g.23364  ORF Transcript_6612/g.23364 Transcript_6612/m.23364 type:complete len:316 (+) Transcript_6612:278-1225(+)